MADTTITVTVGTGTEYLVGGSGNIFLFNGSQPSSFTFPWVQSATVRLDQSESTNNSHPLIFSTSNSTNTITMRSGIISSNVTYYLDGSSNQSDYTNTTTFNAATTRYIEIAPATSTDFYFACWVHGISMGGIVDITSNTWGALTWGENEWNDQGDETVTLTGQAMTVAANAAGVVATQFPGWGTLEWGENGWGSVNEAKEVLPGQAASMALGTLSPVIGEVLTGFQIQTVVGTPTTSFDFALSITGQEMSVAQGVLGVNSDEDTEVGMPSNLNTMSVGALTVNQNADVNVGLSGFSISTDVGNLIEATQVKVILTGQAMTGSVGAITPDDMAVGAVSPGAMTFTVNPAVTVPNYDTVVSLTGLELTVNMGTQFGILHYGDVDTGTNTSYTDVDTTQAAA